MDSSLSSTFTSVLTAREAATVVDFGSTAATDANADGSLSSRELFNDVELDFEGRNWRQARIRFEGQSKHERERINDFLRQYETPQQAKEYCIAARGKASKEYAPAVGGVLSKIETFMKVGDVAMKSAPESVGLVWMGIRLCMHSVQDDFATFSLFSGAASDIVGILLSCRAYGKMYGGDGGQKGLSDFQELHQKVVEYIPKIYSDVLEFSYQMRKHMGRNIGVRFFKGLLSSAVNKFRGMIDGIRFSETTMSKYAQQATQQLSIYYAELGDQKHDNILGNQNVMMTGVASIQDMLNESARAQKIENARTQKLLEEYMKEQENEKKHMKKMTPRDEAKERFEANKGRLRPTSSSEIALGRGKLMRSGGTCEWIFDLDPYKAWRNSTKSDVLWIQGDGGMGKSVLMTTVIDRLQTESASESDSVVQYFIFSSRDESRQTTAQIQSQLVYGLYELANDSPSLELLEKANKIVDKFLSSDNPGQATGSKKSESIGFKETYTSLIKLIDKRINLVIDALDECKDRQTTELLKTLKLLTDASEPPEFHLNIVLCSRPESDILEALSELATIRIQEHNRPDIERDAKAKLEVLPGLSAPEQLLAREAIVNKAQGLFRCVDPAIDFLKRPWKRPLEQALEKLPDGLTNSYQQIFRQTDPQYIDLLKTALHWCILGEREPTIAEIMDDYTCAYEQEDGSEENPYDRLSDPTTSSETKFMIHNQIRESGSNTFLELEPDQQVVKIRHTTVKDFFLPATSPLAPAHGHDQEHLCAECKTKVNSNQTWTLSRKEGHLRMAIVIFKHLNSPLFRKRYLEEVVPPETNEIDEVKDGAEQIDKVDQNEKQEGPEASTEVAPTQEAERSPSEQTPQSADPVSSGDSPQRAGDAGREELAKEQTAEDSSRAAIEEPFNSDADGVSKKNDVGVQDEQSTALASAEQKEQVEAPAAEQTSAAQDEASVEKPAVTEQDDATEIDSVDGEGSLYSYEDQDERSSIYRTGRYEIIYWPHHLMQVEKLWTSEEKENNPLLKELWDSVIKFFCDSPGVFRAWQLKYRSLTEEVWNIETTDNLTPLQIAAMYGLTALCKMLIVRGESATFMTEDHRSALWFASAKNVELQRLLLENGADPNHFKDLLSPFHKLLYLNAPIEAIKLMLDFKADCKMHSQLGLASAHWCAGWCQDPEILRLLLANGAEINAIDDFGEAGLHKLMWQVDTPKDLLEEFIKAGADVNMVDKDEQQPLYEVCSQGSNEGCRILLEHGADIEHADINGITALHAAARNGSYECEKLLIERHASLTCLDKHNRTPFWHACANGYAGSAKLLLDAAHEQGHHNIINLAADDGRSPLSKASGSGHLEVVKVIIEHTDANIDINALETPLKRTALHWAAKNGRVEVVAYLLEQGADATIKDSDGKTALNLSAMGWLRDKQSQREPLVLALIDRDSAAAAQDTNLMTNAALRGSTKVIDKLIDAGADPSKQDEHGWTPHQLARQYNHEDAVALLAKRGAVAGSRPSRWKPNFPFIIISQDGRSLESHNEAMEAYTIQTDHPIPAGVPSFYYEVTISPDVEPPDATLAVGLVCQPAKLEDCLPGWYNPLARGWGYHNDDGQLYHRSQRSEDWREQLYGKGETVGCGVVYGDDGVDGKIFFTKEGQSLGWAFESDVVGRLYPAVGVQSTMKCTANWGDDLEERPFKWAPANARRFGADKVEDVPAVGTLTVGVEETGAGTDQTLGTAVTVTVPIDG